jgi:hypothetical protein
MARVCRAASGFTRNAAHVRDVVQIDQTHPPSCDD